MRAFDEHVGVAMPLPEDNINTDVIIPSREMRTVSKSGLADGLFAPWRYLDPDSAPATPVPSTNTEVEDEPVSATAQMSQATASTTSVQNIVDEFDEVFSS